jgi:hypothetical protein
LSHETSLSKSSFSVYPFFFQYAESDLTVSDPIFDKDIGVHPMNAEPLIDIEEFEFFADGLDHPEGLAFDRDQNLWAGGELGQLYCIDGAGTVNEVVRLGGFCLGLTFSREQDLWVCNSKLGALQQVDRSGRLLRSLDQVDSAKLLTPNFLAEFQQPYENPTRASLDRRASVRASSYLAERREEYAPSNAVGDDLRNAWESDGQTGDAWIEIGSPDARLNLRRGRKPRPCSSESSRLFSPLMWESMATTEANAYRPLGFGYSNYGRSGYRQSILRFTDIPAGFGGFASGSVLGDTGLGVPRFLGTATSPVSQSRCQSTTYFFGGGQPGNRVADERFRKQESNDFLRSRAYLRPNWTGFIEFQNAASEWHENVLERPG